MSNTVAGVLRERVATAPDEQLVKCGGDWLTVREVDVVSTSVAAGLAGLGVAMGDRVLIMLPNRQEMLELFFACARMGAVQVPVNIYLKGSFLEYQLRDSTCRVAVVDLAGYQAIAPIAAATGIRTIVLVDPASAGEADPGPDITVLDYSALRAETGSAPEVEIHDDDLVSILYTSGTTGASKGCMLSNAYYTTPPRMFRDANWLADEDRIITPFQLFHGAAHAILMKGLVAKNGAVCFETSFSASNFMRRAREERASLLWLLPPMAAAILAQADDGTTAACSDIRLSVVPGLPEHAQLEFERRFGGQVGSNFYGQTESLGVAFGSLTDGRKPGSIGRPSPHVDVRLVDDHDNEVPVGEPGEIVVRPRIPHSIYSGYWNKPEATADTWRNLWHHTGDLATRDDEGYLYFVDRKKDSLRRRGENVSSFELETAIARCEKVDRVAVCAIPSPLGEDDIKAVIVLVPGATVLPQEMFDFFTNHLPYFAIPRYVDVRDSLPLTEATGRVQKYVLRKEGVTEAMWDFEKLGLTLHRSLRR